MRGRAKVVHQSFAFITADGGDLFAHASDFAEKVFASVVPGDLVEFEEVQPTPPKGRRAREVRLPSSATTAEVA